MFKILACEHVSVNGLLVRAWKNLTSASHRELRLANSLADLGKYSTDMSLKRYKGVLGYNSVKC